MTVKSIYGLLLLAFNCSKIFELHIFHMGTILNFYLKSGISLCLEGRMMVTIINLKKNFTRRENVEVVYFCIYKIN